MSAKSKLIAFMQYKANQLFKASNINYFTEKDQKDIEKWDNISCKKIWNFIVKEIERGKEGLSARLCPYCIKYRIWSNECENYECEYGKRHGFCYQSDSDFQKIKEECNDHELLPNKWYKKIIKRIEDEIL